MQNNQEIAKIFYKLGKYFEMDSVAFKPSAYEKAGDFVVSMDDDLDDVYKKGGLKALEDLPGIGKSMAEKIEEYLKIGKVKELADFEKKMPVDIDGLTAVEILYVNFCCPQLVLKVKDSRLVSLSTLTRQYRRFVF